MRIKVRAKPGAKRTEVNVESRLDGETYVVSVTEPPRAGRANRAIEDALARHFGVPRGAVRIVAGFMGREKTVEIIM